MGGTSLLSKIQHFFQASSSFVFCLVLYFIFFSNIPCSFCLGTDMLLLDVKVITDLCSGSYEEHMSCPFKITHTITYNFSLKQKQVFSLNLFPCVVHIRETLFHETGKKKKNLKFITHICYKRKYYNLKKERICVQKVF